jgi:hypothetical protein
MMMVWLGMGEIRNTHKILRNHCACLSLETMIVLKEILKLVSDYNLLMPSLNTLMSLSENYLLSGSLLSSTI